MGSEIAGMGARILVLGVKVPFTSGGQEALVRSLVRELTKRGHLVDTIDLPFVVEPKEQLLRILPDLNQFELARCPLIWHLS